MLPIHERFYSFQGEGVHMGRAAFFIRTFGCALKCPWCDSAGTWHPEYVPKEISRMTEHALAMEAQDSNAEFVVVTGGEPTHHDLTALTSMLHGIGLKVHLETSGAYPIQGQFDWITLSPKRSKLPLAINVARASEFKFIIEEPNDIQEWYEYICTRGSNISQPVWLHPEWSKRTAPAVLDAIVQSVKGCGDPFRAGWQLHKLFKADLGDTRSAPAVPLGGNPDLGY